MLTRAGVKNLFASKQSAQPPIPEPAKPSSPSEPAPIVVTKLNWNELGFPDYHEKGRIAFVIDNLFTEEDCKRLLDAAEAFSPWQIAAVNTGPNPEDAVVDTTYRNSDRILFDTPEHSEWIFEKLKPYLDDIQTMPIDKFKMLDKHIPKEETTVQLSRLNERLRFLRYAPGGFFQRHCDGSYVTDDHTEMSYFTLQLYLRGDAESLQGGATRFTSFKSPKNTNGSTKCVDVEPRTGRVLIFEQSSLLHSGEPVTKGQKLTVRTDFMYKRAPPA